MQPNDCAHITAPHYTNGKQGYKPSYDFHRRVRVDALEFDSNLDLNVSLDWLHKMNIF